MNTARTGSFGVGLAILFAMLMSACSTQARRVDCDGRLEPINQPAAIAKGAPSNMPAASTEKRDR